jgi:hypothetical protein
MPTTISETYLITSPNDDVLLDVVIGNAQHGNISVYLGPAPLATAPQFTKLRLGKGSEVRGKRLVIAGIIIDVNPNSDQTSMSSTISGGGSQPKTIDSSEKVGTGGTSAQLHVVTFL